MVVGGRLAPCIRRQSSKAWRECNFRHATGLRTTHLGRFLPGLFVFFEMELPGFMGTPSNKKNEINRGIDLRPWEYGVFFS